MEVSGQLHAPATLAPYPLDRMLVGPPSRSERVGEDKESLLLWGIEPRLPSP